MEWRTEPVASGRFDDFADVINPRRRATHCWCLSHRLPARQVEELGGGSREEGMRALCRQAPPGVVTYADDVPVGWCHISPRADIPRLASGQRAEDFGSARRGLRLSPPRTSGYAGEDFASARRGLPTVPVRGLRTRQSPGVTLISR